MTFSIFTRVLFLGAVLALSACGGSSSGGSPDREVSVSGKVLNGPLAGAEVSVFDAGGALLGTAVTDADGSFSITLINPQAPLRLVSEGGELDGNPYLGTLRADCQLSSSAESLTCNLTPWSSLAAARVDSGLTVAEAAAQLFDVFGLAEDPFVQDATTPDSVPLYKFDLDAARTAIGDGSGLTGWIDLMQVWVDAFVVWLGELDEGNEDALIVGTAPAGTPLFRIELQQLTAGGSAGPAYVDVPMGGQADFSIIPDVNHVAVVGGCGGVLQDNVYTTGVIVSAGVITGVCKVKVSFPLEQFELRYSAGLGGSVVGALAQTVSFGGSGSEVVATPADGYLFDEWSDGLTTPERTDSNVTADIDVKALFTPKIYTLKYTAGEGGALSVENEGVPEIFELYEQQVSFGQSGVPVTAVPDAGYEFSGWSDGESLNPRVTGNVADDLDVTAQFQLIDGAIPWLQAQHGGDLQVVVLGPTAAELDWSAVPGVQYDLYISPVANMLLDEYAAFGGTLIPDVSPPYLLDGLAPGEPVYVAIRADNELHAWSSLVPRTWGVDGEVRTQALDLNGNRYVGGDFGSAILNFRAGTTLAPASSGAAAHPLVFPDVDGVIHAIVDDGQGGWYIGGQFSRVDGLPRQNLAQIDAGGKVTDWGGRVTGGNATVFALASLGSGLVVGGDFTMAGTVDGDVARSNLAIFLGDGTVFDEFDVAVNGPVKDILALPGVILIGGGFSSVAGQNYSGFALLGFNEGSFGQVIPWNSRVNGTVNAIAIDSQRIILGGDFNEVVVNETPVQRSLLAVFDGTGSLQSLAPQFTGSPEMQIFSLTIRDGILMVGGSFDAVDGEPRSGLASFSAENLLLPEVVSVNGSVHSFADAGSVFYVAGDFSSAAGVSGSGLRRSVAAFDQDDNLLDWNPRLHGVVSQIVVANDVVAVSGDLKGAASETPRNNIAAFGPEGELLPWAPSADAPVNALAVEGDAVYLGGAFTQLGNPVADTGRAFVGAVDRLTGAVTSWNPAANGEVHALMVDAGVIYFAGSFSEAGALPRQNLAAADVDGLLQSWNPGSNGIVSALLADAGVVYAGGSFTAAGGGTADTGRLNLAAFDASGALLPWNPGADGNVASLTALNGNIYAGGAFLNAGGGTADTGRAHLAAFDSAGNLLGWNPGANGVVTSLSADTAVYAGGAFSEVGAAVVREGMAAFDDAGLVLEWNPGAVLDVRSVLAANGLVFVAGAFDRVGGASDPADDPRAGLAVIDATGTLLSR